MSVILYGQVPALGKYCKRTWECKNAIVIRSFSSNGVYFFVMWTVNKLVGKLSRAFVYKGGRHTRGARHPIRTNHNAAARKRGQQPNIRRWRAEVVVHVFFVQIEIADNTSKSFCNFTSAYA